MQAITHGKHGVPDRMIAVSFQRKSFITTVIQVYAPMTNAEKLKLNSSMKTYNQTKESIRIVRDGKSVTVFKRYNFILKRISGKTTTNIKRMQ